MKKEHMSLWGIGPIYVVVCCLLTIFVIFIHHSMYPKFSINFLSELFFHVIGICLMVIGFIVWFSAVFLSKLDKNIKEDKLVTSGIYAYVRNPIYSGISFFLTGILIWQCSYITLILPILFYIILRFLVRKEEIILEERFGKEYLEYKQKTNAVFPWKKR